MATGHPPSGKALPSAPETDSNLDKIFSAFLPQIRHLLQEASDESLLYYYEVMQGFVQEVEEDEEEPLSEVGRERLRTLQAITHDG